MSDPQTPAQLLTGLITEVQQVSTWLEGQDPERLQRYPAALARLYRAAQDLRVEVENVRDGIARQLLPDSVLPARYHVRWRPWTAEGVASGGWHSLLRTGDLELALRAASEKLTESGRAWVQVEDHRPTKTGEYTSMGSCVYNVSPNLPLLNEAQWAHVESLRLQLLDLRASRWDLSQRPVPDYAANDVLARRQTQLESELGDLGVDPYRIQDGRFYRLNEGPVTLPPEDEAL